MQRCGLAAGGAVSRLKRHWGDELLTPVFLDGWLFSPFLIPHKKKMGSFCLTGGKGAFIGDYFSWRISQPVTFGAAQ